MEALCSASNRVFGASGWIEVTGGIGAPPSFEGGCLPDSGAVWASEIVFGWGLNWIWPPSPFSRGICSPVCPAAEVSPYGATLMASCTSPWPGKVLQDNTSVSSVALGEEAAESDPLSITFGSSKFPKDEERWGWARARLQRMV